MVYMGVSGLEVEKALSVKPTSLELKYPFEWAGLFEFRKGDYYITLEDGPDATMSMLVVRLDQLSQRAIAALKDIAAPRTRTAKTRSSSQQAVAALKDIVARKFLEREQKVQPGKCMEASGHVYQLQLQGEGRKTFKLSAPSNGAYVLFTQHLPEEFALSVSSTKLVQEPIYAEEFVAERSHDNASTFSE
jgi:hypothetical protein